MAGAASASVADGGAPGRWRLRAAVLGVGAPQAKGCGGERFDVSNGSAAATATTHLDQAASGLLATMRRAGRAAIPRVRSTGRHDVAAWEMSIEGGLRFRGQQRKQWVEGTMRWETAGITYNVNIVYVTPSLRTGTVCKLGDTVCRLGAFGAQFVDCTRWKLSLQTVPTRDPVCKLGLYGLQTGACKYTRSSSQMVTLLRRTRRALDRDHGRRPDDCRAEAPVHRGDDEETRRAG